MEIKTYEEFREEWYASFTNDAPDCLKLSEGLDERLKEYFCGCDYKRYTGEWLKESL